VNLYIRYQVLSDIYRSKNNNNLALKYQDLSKSSADSLNNLAAIQKIGALGTYQKLKDQEIEKLTLQNHLKDEELKFTKLKTAGIMGMACLILVLVGLYILFQLNHKLKTKNNRISSQYKQLEELNLTKNKLFAVISHDFKSPINTINSFLLLMKEKTISREKFDTYVDQLLAYTNRASDLTNNILKWAQSQLEGIQMATEQR